MQMSEEELDKLLEEYEIEDQPDYLFTSDLENQVLPTVEERPTWMD